MPEQTNNDKTPHMHMNIEQQRMITPELAAPWREWGPYVADRAWGTVREDYSPDGDAWNYFPHDFARSRAYRWSEDGIGGICDRQQILCFAPAFWNGKDPILKERLFGLTNQEGNHGEDVKEYWFTTDNMPSHAYMKMVYRYPQFEYPYRQLVEINKHRGPLQPEYELVDTSIFTDNAFFDIVIEYAKADPTGICIRFTVRNCGKETATLHLLPTLWFRNTWGWSVPPGQEPKISLASHDDMGDTTLLAEHSVLGQYRLYARNVREKLFTFNETNRVRLYGTANSHPAVKDAFHEYLVHNQLTAVHQQPWGTKAALYYSLKLSPGATQSVGLVLTNKVKSDPFADFDQIFAERMREADAFYGAMLPHTCDPAMRAVQRQAVAGLLWNKQFYNYDVKTWLHGDADSPAPPQRLNGRNSNWTRLRAKDVIVMPDTWEYPWFAAWDWAFHCLTLSYVDIELAKEQLELICSERYQNLSAQLPAYEWSFDDVNPPVQALVTWRVYNMGKRRNQGKGDRGFLERMYHKLLLNFVWWVSRKDNSGRNIFEGGFLGLDNISVFDRNHPLPSGQLLEQADATGWMGLFCLNMLTIALELSQEDPVYSHLAVKFFDHFIAISQAINMSNENGNGLWDEQDGFYYDKITYSNSGQSQALRVRSNVGLTPLYAVQVIEKSWIEKLPAFQKVSVSERIEKNKGKEMVGISVSADGNRILLSIANRDRLQRVLQRVVDENEFLSSYGLRSLSRYHLNYPYRIIEDGQEWMVQYEAAESRSTLFGGNSNWRGPIWFPTAYLLITALRTYQHFYGDSVTVPWPGNPGRQMNLLQLSEELARRMISIFTPDKNGRRPVFGNQSMFQENPLWKDFILFHEYFNGENGAGLGASHQTGWTALVVQLIDYVTRSYTESGG
ncbi:MAG TPA: glucosidase [Phycisphaerae bacterium]|nr:glucosidase [Phycisphaerae bacterium]